jgi:hypothetical protein
MTYPFIDISLAAKELSLPLQGCGDPPSEQFVKALFSTMLFLWTSLRIAAFSFLN